MDQLRARNEALLLRLRCSLADTMAVPKGLVHQHVFDAPLRTPVPLVKLPHPPLHTHAFPAALVVAVVGSKRRPLRALRGSTTALFEALSNSTRPRRYANVALVSPHTFHLPFFNRTRRQYRTRPPMLLGQGVVRQALAQAEDHAVALRSAEARLRTLTESLRTKTQEWCVVLHRPSGWLAYLPPHMMHPYSCSEQYKKQLAAYGIVAVDV